MSIKFSKDHYVLLKNSEAINEEPRLKALLEKHELITEPLIKTMDPDMQNIFDNMMPRLISLAQDEWKAEEYPDEDRGDDKEDWVKCSLCGTKNKIVYYIHNTHNGKSLNVGSQCIRKFDILENQGINHKEYQRRRLRFLRINKLNNHIQGIENSVDKWNDILDSYELILPYSLERPYIEMGNKIRNCFDSFIKDNCSKDEEARIIKDIQEILDQRKQWVKDVDIYLEKYKNHKYAPRHTLRLWLKNHSDAALISDWIKEDGLITQRTAHRITEPQFMNMISSEFEKLCLGLDYEISGWKADPDKKGYIIYCDPIKSAALLCSHSNLIKRFGSNIFGGEKKEPELRELIVLCNIVSENYYYRISEALTRKLRRAVSYYSENFRFNEITFRENVTGKYVILDFKDFINRFILVAYECSNDSIEVVEDHILQPGRKRHSKSEIDDHEKYIGSM